MADKDTDLHSKIDRLADSTEKRFQQTHQNQREAKKHGVSNFAMNILQMNQNNRIDNTQDKLLELDSEETRRWEKQKKHNKGAKNARIQIIETQEMMLEHMRRGGGFGGGHGGPGGPGGGTGGPGGLGGPRGPGGGGGGRGGSGGGGGGRGNTGGWNWGNNDAGGPWGPISPLSGGGRTSNVVDHTGFVDASRIRKEPVAATRDRTGYLGRRGEQIDVQGRIINERQVGGRRGAGAALRGLRGETITQRLAGMDNQWAGNEKGMRKLTIGGREMARAEVGKDGKTRFRDERTGQFAREEKYQQSERRRGIFESTLERTGANTQYQRRATGAGIQRQREVMGASLQQNAGAIQAIVEDNPVLQAEMKELEKLQEKAQGLRGNEGREARQKVSEQLGRITSQDTTGQMGNLLNVQGQRRALESGSGLKDMFNIDQDAGLLTGARQFFGLDRMFGDAGTGGITNLYSQSRKDRLADEAGALGSRMDAQQDALESATGKDMLRLTGGDIYEHDARKGENLEPVAPTTLGEQGGTGPGDGGGPGPAPVRGRATRGSTTGGRFTSGTDTEGVQQRQLEELVRIREVLEQGGGAGGGGGGGGGLLGGLGGAGIGAGIMGGAKKLWGGAKNLAGKGAGLLKGAARFAGPLGLAVTAGTALYGGVKGFNADEDASFGRKLLNAGSGGLNKLSFGLLGSTDEELREAGIARRANQGTADGKPLLNMERQSAEWVENAEDVDAHNIGLDYQAARAKEEEGKALKLAVKEKYGEFDSSEEVVPDKGSSYTDAMGNYSYTTATNDDFGGGGGPKTREIYSDPEAQKEWDAAHAMEREGSIEADSLKRDYKDLRDNINIGESWDSTHIAGTNAVKLTQTVENQQRIYKQMDAIAERHPESVDAFLRPGMLADEPNSHISERMLNAKYNDMIEGELTSVDGPKRKSQLELMTTKDATKLYDEQGRPIPGVVQGSASGTLAKEKPGLFSRLGRMSEFILPGEDGKGALLNTRDMIKGASGAALDYMGETAKSVSETMGTIVNNITNNNGSDTPPENILINPGTVRTSDSTIQRYQDMRYTG